jgi:hypothetical protein
MRNHARSLLLAAALALSVGCAARSTTDPATPYAPHTVNLILGASFNRSGDGVALGGNYEYRTHGKLGYGGFADIAFGDDTSTAVGGAVYYHPADRWGILAGPGVAIADGDADVFARVGGWYAFPFTEFTLAPTAWIDLGEDVAGFFGVSVGFRF